MTRFDGFVASRYAPESIRFTNGMRPEANYCLSTTRDGPSIWMTRNRRCVGIRGPPRRRRGRNDRTFWPMETGLAGWGGRIRTSEFGDAPEGRTGSNREMLRQQKPDILAETTGLSLQTERQCRRLSAFASSWIPPPLATPPLWGFGGDGACAVATERIER
jgi:hypothetical protein